VQDKIQILLKSTDVASLNMLQYAVHDVEISDLGGGLGLAGLSYKKHVIAPK
jgi:hypothetical protein